MINNLPVRLDPSGFAPLCVIYRWVGTHERPVAPYRRPPFRVGSMAGERLYCACWHCTSYTRVGDGAVPRNSPGVYPLWTMNHGGAYHFTISLFVLVPLLLSPFCLIPSPKRRKQQGVVCLRFQATLALFPKIWPFIGPTRHLIGQFLHHMISGNILVIPCT